MIDKIVEWVKKRNLTASVIETDVIFYVIERQFPNVTLRTACAAVDQLREEMYK